MVPSLIGGVLVMGLFGRMLDRLRAPWWPWLLGTPISAAVAAFVMVQTHEDAAVAFGSVGGFLAGAVCALQLGSYAATVVALALGVGRATGV